ncbi:AraC family transcriptional regulator of adaptative response / DNA-3-methyladenine glycosylase II [Parvibaculum indicum]|uniref:DNA-3-methyladenine glycosylase 2 n=1 Tax=Parvibaculum indicum TaxID=562969 RepID=UPI001422CF0F|nr:DNA-3-methyladenine glycosylase 2 [Parvibaculum indicum]NIJ42112.1 AraC family transcriptional regulator of adaptative response / DNA-3-methyladenine glycosylase II [Parvibaculum indicum]
MEKQPHIKGETTPLLDEELCYRAVTARDARFDGRFFTCVRSTGIYCRPVCPAPTPGRKQCVFVSSAAAAEAAGFRSCLRCRPEAAPGAPAWTGTQATVTRALRLIEAGALDHEDIETFAARLGLGGRHLRRLFVTQLGATPQAVAANRRLLTAKQLLTETQLPMADIAHAAGYRSLRRFNGAIRSAYGNSPGALRKANAPARDEDGSIALRLGYRAPYDFPRLLAYLAARAIPGVEAVSGERYMRSFRLGEAAGLIEASDDPSRRSLAIRIHMLRGPLPLRMVVARLKRLFDLDADPDAIGQALAGDDLTGPRLATAPGLRIPGAFDGHELAIRAILGQQVSVKDATTLAGRLAATHGETLEGADGPVTLLFPDPATLARGDLSGLGLTGARMKTIAALSAAEADGRIDLSVDGAAGTGPDETIARLKELPGIGDWTAQYIALRALGEPDAFPAGDLVLRKIAGNGTPVSDAAMLARAAHWRPWRGYAAMALWQIPDPFQKEDAA